MYKEGYQYLIAFLFFKTKLYQQVFLNKHKKLYNYHYV